MRDYVLRSTQRIAIASGPSRRRSRPTSPGRHNTKGTAFTTDTIRRTLYIEYRDWIDRRDVANMLLLAREHLDSRKDTVYEGQCTYEGKLTTALTLGKALNVGRAGGTTGLEALAAPIKSVSLEYQDSASIWLTRMRFSTRRRPFAGDRLFAPVAWGSSAQFAGGRAGLQPVRGPRRRHDARAIGRGDLGQRHDRRGDGGTEADDGGADGDRGLHPGGAGPERRRAA